MALADLRGLATRVEGITRSSFFKSSLALVSGTVLTQGIVFLLSPILSRIFSAADFGNLANYNAWVSILALVSSLRYEHAIIVAPDRESTNGVVALTLALSLTSVLGYVLGALFLYALRPTSGYLQHVSDIVLFIPVGVLFIAVSSVLTQVTVRAGAFPRLATITVVQVCFTVAIQILLGLAGVPHSLIIGTIAGTILFGAILGWLVVREGQIADLRAAMHLSRLRATAKRFANFPRYTLGADALGVLVQQFTPVFILALFNPVYAGLYAFGIRVVRAPLLVVSTAIAAVLRKEGVEHLRREGKLEAMYSPLIKSLFLLGLIPFSIILLFGPQLFAIVFGAKWGEAGRLVQILSPGILLEFVAFPLATFFLITNTQNYTLRVQLAALVLLVTALVIGKMYLGGFVATGVLVSGVMVAVNGATIVLAARVSRGGRAPEPVKATSMVSAL